MFKFLKAVDKTLFMCGLVLEGVLASGVIISVFLRYFFGIAFKWSEEMLIMIFVATTFLGAALGLRQGEHIAISQFLEASSEKLKRILNICIQVIIIFVSLFMIYYGIIIIQKVGGIPSVSTGIKRGVYFSLVPLSFIITIFYAVMNILEQFISLPERDRSYQDDEILVESLGGEK